MSKNIKRFGLIILLGLLCSIFYITSWTPRLLNYLKPIKPEKSDSIVASDGAARTRSRLKREQSLNPGELLKAVEQFDVAMKKLRNANGEDWISGLKDLAEVTNNLGKRSDFKSFTTSALMVRRVSDLVIGRLMTGEVPAKESLKGLESIVYQVPDDQQMFEFICQYYPDGAKDRKRHPPITVLEFVSRFEPDVDFPDERWVDGKTMTGIITEQKATLSLFCITSAKIQLDTARVTALYLMKGGNSNLRGNELGADLAKLVGGEIQTLTKPLFAETTGSERPTGADISYTIGEALRVFR